MQPINRWFLLFRGFTQCEGRPDGFNRLWRRLRPHFRGVGDELQLHHWYDNVDRLAENIFINKNGEDPEIWAAGYSFGGQTAINFAEQCERRGMKVKGLFLCDAVYRFPYKLGWYRSMLPSKAKIGPFTLPLGSLHVPPKVNEVWWFRQYNPRFQLGRAGGFAQPAGHDVVVGSDTQIYGPYDLQCQHAYADDSDMFHNVVVNTFCGKYQQAA